MACCLWSFFSSKGFQKFISSWENVQGQPSEELCSAVIAFNCTNRESYASVFLFHQFQIFQGSISLLHEILHLLREHVCHSRRLLMHRWFDRGSHVENFLRFNGVRPFVGISSTVRNDPSFMTLGIRTALISHALPFCLAFLVAQISVKVFSSPHIALTLVRKYWRDVIRVKRILVWSAYGKYRRKPQSKQSNSQR